MSDLAPALVVTELDRKLRGELKTLVTFVRVYCERRHRDAVQVPVELRTLDLAGLYGRPVRLCAACGKLLQHALVKRMRCPYDPKPMCKKCPTHCYSPAQRAQIQEVMRYSGTRLVLTGRLHYLWHLWS
jgi:hypothetical protein